MEQLDTDIVRRVFVTTDGAELSIDTPFVVRTVSIPQQMRIPLYVNGKIKSTEELTALGLTIKEYTRAEVDAAYYAQLYAAQPRLAQRVRQYKAILDGYGLDASATSDDITAAITADTTKTDAEKTTAAASLLSLIHDIEINYNEAGALGYDAWADLPKLIKYLPPETEEKTDTATETVTETEGA